MEPPPTQPVLGVPLAVIDTPSLCDRVTWEARAGGRFAVEFANVHVTVLRRRDPTFRRRSTAFDLTVPDGVPLVWGMRRTGATGATRVYGPAFMREYMRGCPGDLRHYFLGGSAACQAALTSRMRAINPHLVFAGGFTGRAEEGARAAVLADIERAVPQIVWVALGTPRQQEWIAWLKPRIARGVLLSVGYAFDVNAGLKRDAPAWMHRSGLTWLHRLAQEPGRLAGRYLRYNSLFLLHCLREGIAGPPPTAPSAREPDAAGASPHTP